MVVIDLHLTEVGNLRANLDAVAEAGIGEVRSGVADFDCVIAWIPHSKNGLRLDGLVHLPVACPAADRHVGGDFPPRAVEQSDDGVEQGRRGGRSLDFQGDILGAVQMETRAMGFAGAR